MTPADELRKAAQHVLDLAQKATPGPWRHEDNWTLAGDRRLTGTHQAVVAQEPGDSWDTVAITGHMGEHEASGPTAQHIALWDPNLTAKLAAWLTCVAIDDETEPESGPRIKERAVALDVARAINEKAATA